MPSFSHSLRRVVMPLVALSVTGAVTPIRGEAAEPALAGAVDATPFLRFAAEEDRLLEVELKPSVLRALSRAAKRPDEARALKSLTSVKAVILELEPQQVAPAMKQLDTTAAELKAKGWEEMAVVRERGSRIRVLMLPRDERIAGLTVLMLEHEKAPGRRRDGGEERPQLIFANLTGPFDLADLQRFGGHLDIPGLERALGESGAAGQDSGRAP